MGMSDLDAVILVGGQGTRLRAVVSDRPKPMAEVRGRPFLAWLLDMLKASGVTRVALSTGFMADYFEDAIGDGSRFGMKIDYAVEASPLGTGGGLRNALPLLASDPVLVMNGDSWCDFELAPFLRRHRESGAAATILLSRVENKSRYGGVTLDPDDRILRFDEKGGSNEPGWINGGVYLLSRTLIAAIPPHANVSLERDVFPQTRELFGFRSSGRFIDIGTPESYQQAHDLFSSMTGVSH